MNVSEIFSSIQGEGQLAGMVSVFIRLAGCDLRCQWCDSTYALETRRSKKQTVDEVLTEVRRYDCTYVVVTGGEPLISAELPNLLQALSEQGKHITVETSATQYRPIRCDLASISPKLAQSIPRQGRYIHYAETHKNRRLNIPAIQYFINHHDYQLKFVIRDESDLAEVDEILAQLEGVNKDQVMLMPQARTKQEYRKHAPNIAQICIERGFRYCPRLQIELWGNRRRR